MNSNSKDVSQYSGASNPDTCNGGGQAIKVTYEHREYDRKNGGHVVIDKRTFETKPGKK